VGEAGLGSHEKYQNTLFAREKPMDGVEEELQTYGP
jgi:hypothetical protein